MHSGEPRVCIARIVRDITTSIHFSPTRSACSSLTAKLLVVAPFGTYFTSEM